MSADEHIVGLIAELRQPVTRWGEVRAHPVALLPGRQDLRPWTPLGDTPTGRRWFVGHATLRFHTDATGRYIVSLESDDPRVWVAMRPTGADPPFEIAAITVDSDEGESFTENPGDMIETVPMPAEIATALARFTTANHRERVFIKRKRKEWRKDGGA